MKNINRKLAGIAIAGIAIAGYLLSGVTAVTAQERAISKQINNEAISKQLNNHAIIETTDSYVLSDGAFVEVREVSSKETIDENIEKVFSGLDLSVLPSKILLETGALFQRRAILQKNGVSQSSRRGKREDAENEGAGNSVPFAHLYEGIARAAKDGHHLPSLREVQHKATSNFKKHNALPLAISVVNYESIDERALEDGRLVNRGGRLHATGKADYWQSHQFIDAGLVPFEAATENINQMVIPSDMFLTNHDVKGGPLLLKSATIRFEGTDATVKAKPDQPFSIPLEALLNDKNALGMSITLKTNGGKYNFNAEIYVEITPGEFAKTDSTLGTSPKPILEKPHFRITPLPIVSVPSTPMVEGDLPYCDIAQTQASVPFWGLFGRLNHRVYPASTNVEDCNNLKRVLVLVDGFDVMNNRTLNTLSSDFSAPIRHFVSLGYDVVLVDYVVGNDPIQRNGQAFRKFMVNTIPALMSNTPDTTDVAVIAGSMGGQVVNFGLRHAELAGEVHNAKLFMTLDTEYHGANIPISLQYEIGFLAQLAAVASNIPGYQADPGISAMITALNSPAARQLLRHHYNSPTGGYASHPLYDAFRAEMISLGLPQMTRNVSIANGSGTGDVFASVKKQLSSVVKTGFLSIRLKAYTDHPGAIFWGQVNIGDIPILHNMVTLLSGAMFDDVRPGSARETPSEVAEAYNSGNSNLMGTMYYGLGKHNFVPTESAVGTGFDYSYHEKCNSGHATPTVGNMEVMVKELLAMKNGVQPLQAAPYSQPCGQPEPEACAQSVSWWNYSFLSPTPTGASCRVAYVQSGAVAFTQGRSFYVERAEPCPYPWNTDSQTGRCNITSAFGAGTEYDNQSGELTIYKRVADSVGMTIGDEPDCPFHTYEISSTFPNFYYGDNYGNFFSKVCKIWPSLLPTPGDAEVAGDTLVLIQDELCPTGGRLDGVGCFMGKVPLGTQPTISGSAYRYIE